MADTIVITKLSNGNVLINNDGTENSMPPDYGCFKTGGTVEVRNREHRSVVTFTPEDVEKVVREDTTEVIINDVDTLFTELITFFFFKLTGGGGGSDPNANLKHLGEFDNYTDLITQHPSADVGTLAYCINNQGTFWLPGGMGGTFYSKGTYAWTGSVWDSAVDDIAKAIEDINDQIDLGLAGVLTKNNTADPGQDIVLKDTGKVRVETGSGPTSTRLEMGVEGNDVVLRAPNTAGAGDDVLIDAPNVGNWVKFRSGIVTGNAGWRALGNGIATFIATLSGANRTITFQDKDHTVAGIDDLSTQVTTAQMFAISSPQLGRIYFNTTINQDVYWNGTMWVSIGGEEVFNEILINDFESGIGSFVTVNGGENDWVVGTANPASGSQSLYISNNGGTTNTYTSVGVALDVSHVYRDIALPSAANKLILEYDYLCEAEIGFDWGTLHDVPTTTTPVANTELGAVGSLPLVQYNDQLTFTKIRIELPLGEGGTTRRFVWGFRNDSSVENNPPFNIDNVKILYN